MKRFIAFTVALLFIVLCFSACGKKDDPDNTESTEKNDDPVGTPLTVEDLPFDFYLEANEKGVAASAIISSWNEISSTITVPETLEYNGHVYPITRIGMGQNVMISNPETLTTLVLTANIKSISPAAFANCTNLSVVRFEEGLEEIGESAFYGCALTALELPSTVKAVRKAAFSANDLTAVYINSGIETIEDRSFGYLLSLETISIPRRFQGRLDEIFFYCPTLTAGTCKIIIPD